MLVGWPVPHLSQRSGTHAPSTKCLCVTWCRLRRARARASEPGRTFQARSMTDWTSLGFSRASCPRFGREDHCFRRRPRRWVLSARRMSPCSVLVSSIGAPPWSCSTQLVKVRQKRSSLATHCVAVWAAAVHWCWTYRIPQLWHVQSGSLSATRKRALCFCRTKL